MTRNQLSLFASNINAIATIEDGDKMTLCFLRGMLVEIHRRGLYYVDGVCEGNSHGAVSKYVSIVNEQIHQS